MIFKHENMYSNKKPSNLVKFVLTKRIKYNKAKHKNASVRRGSDGLVAPSEHGVELRLLRATRLHALHALLNI